MATGMRARGWQVLTLAAAPEPGAAAYSIRAEEGLVRVANNAPWANLRRGESDPAIDAVIARVERDFRPDLVHVQHLQFLSATWSTRAPVLWTLHDAWAWCAAGGLLLRDGKLHDGKHCAGPGTACAPCASRQARDTPALAQLMGVAGRLSPWIDPPRLHALWRRLPPAWRTRALAGPVPMLDPSDITRRDASIRAFAARCACILSPSRWLAEEAVRSGLPAPRVLPHGVDPPPDPAAPSRKRRDAAATGPFVFLGTLAPHKGPHLVWEAWQRARLGTPLRIIGPDGPDAAYTATFPHEGPVNAGDVPALLAGARALVLGSVWPENAPLVVLEARAVGCPVIAPAIGGLPELVEPGVDGWLYPPGDIDALSACLRAAERDADPAGGVRVRPPPTLDAHLEQLGTIYAEILAR